ncbi:unnamed protein product, partial [Prorocentrum cordatum]
RPAARARDGPPLPGPRLPPPPPRARGGGSWPPARLHGRRGGPPPGAVACLSASPCQAAGPDSRCGCLPPAAWDSAVDDAVSLVQRAVGEEAVQCASWCRGHAGEWATKCTFQGCGACDACDAKAARRGDGPEWKRPLRVHVTSVGGVGTTGFIEELRNVSARIRTNDPIDNDQVKHAPYLRLVGEVDAGSVPHRRFKAKLPDKMIYLSAR